MIICAFQACERILLELFTNKESAVFHEPVSKLVCRASIYHMSEGFSHVTKFLKIYSIFNLHP